MNKCIKCDNVDGLKRAGFIRGKQRYYCRHCNIHFVYPETTSITKNNTNATISDVAKYLGVSISTVSRALNDKSDINLETKRAIVETAKQLDYQPNLLAKSLHDGKTNIIGVVLPDVMHPFFARVLAGIQNIANKSKYNIIVCHSDENNEVEIRNVENLVSFKVDGILISHTKNTTDASHIKNAIKKGIPVVQFDRVFKNLDITKVISQDYNGSFYLVEHLIMQGCKKIAIMLGPKDLNISNQRLEGYLAALRHFGISVNNDYIVHSDISTNDSQRTFDYFMSLENPPDAIFTVFYRNSIEMMSLAKNQGFKIPEQLAFVSYGDDALVEFFEPSLTVFNQYPIKIGETSMNSLLNEINNKLDTSKNIITIEGKLIIRNSSLRLPPNQTEISTRNLKT
jgi:LacI family transcriptional regulator